MTLLTPKSLGKARWVMNDPSVDQVDTVMRRHDLPEIIARMLVSRGVEEAQILAFLQPTLREHFPDPFKLAGMEAMAQDLSDAIIAGRKIAIFGDFDVDGATSAAVLFRFLKACGVLAPIYIPDRLAEGYGPNLEAMKTLQAGGAEIVVMLDCGTTAHQIVKQARELGLEIIILDHHEAEETLPPANHVINPKRKDDESGYDMLAACGVTFLSCVAVNKILREKEFFKGEAPDLKSFLDIVALGTVCDMVPLTGPNRLFVRHGFQLMQTTRNEGLKALIQVSQLKNEITPTDAGFALGPRINAGSRVHKADLGARLLTSDDPEEALGIAWTLEDCNARRKSIQQGMEREAIKKVEDLGLHRAAAIVVDGEDWHPGLSGLVAGRLKEQYGKPACVVTYAENMEGVREGRGSGRSIPGVHIAESFIAAREAGLLVKGGGHAMAGGFTVLPEKLEDLRRFITAHVERQLGDDVPHVETVIDGVLSVRGIQSRLIKMLESQVGPFGQGFEEPLFLLQNVRIYTADVLGESHIRLMIGDWEGGPRLKAMAFKAVGTDMGQAFLKQGKRPFHILGQLKINSWQGRESPEMHIKDADFAGEEGVQDYDAAFSALSRSSA
jgi:single-stranded-DNA-specific exonuclease